jgi:hypothetical protein
VLRVVTVTSTDSGEKCAMQLQVKLLSSTFHSSTFSPADALADRVVELRVQQRCPQGHPFFVLSSRFILALFSHGRRHLLLLLFNLLENGWPGFPPVSPAVQLCHP